MIRFGTSGWRAIIGDGFTFGNVRLVTQAVADVLLEEGAGSSPPVLVGYDTRFLSERVAREMATVLSANGVRALICSRDAPTPAFARLIPAEGAQAGIYVTASHNPPEYNGLKLYAASGTPAPPSLTDRVEHAILCLQNRGFDRSYIAREPLIRSVNPQEAYLKALLDVVDIGRIRDAGLRLAVDTLYGTAREYLDRVLIENECAVDVLHNFVDPYFGGYSPACSQQNLAELAALVRSSEASLGLATDGDGDRFGVLAEDGSYLSADDVLAVLLDYAVRERGLRGGVARTVATSHLIDRVAGAHGLDVRETPVGFKYIAPLLLSGEVTFGGEESGGMTLGEHLADKDGILACLLVAESVAVTGLSVRQQRDRLWAAHGEHHHRSVTLATTAELERELSRAVRTPPGELGGVRVAEVRTIDGLKLVLEDGSWCLLRRSGTEPALRVYAEGSSPLRLERLIHDARELLAPC